jgi:hypothetical protein
MDMYISGMTIILLYSVHTESIPENTPPPVTSHVTLQYGEWLYTNLTSYLCNEKFANRPIDLQQDLNLPICTFLGRFKVT